MKLKDAAAELKKAESQEKKDTKKITNVAFKEERNKKIEQFIAEGSLEPYSTDSRMKTKLG